MTLASQGASQDGAHPFVEANSKSTADNSLNKRPNEVQVFNFYHFFINTVIIDKLVYTPFIVK